MYNDFSVEDNIHEKLNDAVEEYYSQNKKNILFKSRQKNDCAEYISNTYNIDELLSNTIYIVTGKPYLYIDYTLLKLFINENNYINVIRRYQTMFEECYITNNAIEVHLNLDTFTISAAHRYRIFIERFANECMMNGAGYSSLLSKFVIYNAPNMLDNMFGTMRHIVDQRLMSKIEIIPKKDSAARMKDLFGIL
jgi:hypothetical protein